MIHSKYYQKDYTQAFIRTPYICLVISIVRLLFIRFLYMIARGQTYGSSMVTVYLIYAILLIIQWSLCSAAAVSYLNCDQTTKMSNGKECKTLLSVIIIIDILNVAAYSIMLVYGTLGLVLVASILEVILAVIYLVLKRRVNNGRTNSF